MPKFYWPALAELGLFVVTFGVIMPITLSASDTTLVLLGLGWLLGIFGPLAGWYIPKWGYDVYLQQYGEKPNVEVNRVFDDQHSDAEHFNYRMQQSAAGKRGRPSKQPGKREGGGVE